MRIFGIIPAAGRSRRMGQPKQLLDINGRPLLETTLAPLLAAPLECIMLVTRRAIAKLLNLSDPRLQVIFNEATAAEMIDSIRLALRQIVHEFSPALDDGILIVPGDQPGLSSDDLRRCIDAFFAAPDRIVIAVYQGRRGHPIIFPAALADFVLSSACNQGLRALPAAHHYLVRLVDCESPAITRNLNTPEDLSALQ